MKQPVYKGPKKNHSSIWLGEDDNKFNPDSRFRIVTSVGKWSWYSQQEVDDIFEGKEFPGRPCWLDLDVSQKENIKRMKAYDERIGLETIFLGYVKDTE